MSRILNLLHSHILVRSCECEAFFNLVHPFFVCIRCKTLWFCVSEHWKDLLKNIMNNIKTHLHLCVWQAFISKANFSRCILWESNPLCCVETLRAKKMNNPSEKSFFRFVMHSNWHHRSLIEKQTTPNPSIYACLLCPLGLFVHFSPRTDMHARKMHKDWELLLLAVEMLLGICSKHNRWCDYAGQ